MGWSSGSILADELWTTVRPFIAEKNRKHLAKQIIVLFEDMDCDTLDECESLMKDAGEES